MNRSAELQLGAARRASHAPTWRSALPAARFKVTRHARNGVETAHAGGAVLGVRGAWHVSCRLPQSWPQSLPPW